MPELPEVETVARQLAPRLIGRRIRRLRILDSRLRDGCTPRLSGRRIVDVARAGKQVLIEFSGAAPGGSGLWLTVHLRMTGRLIWDRRTRIAPAPALRARFTLDRGSLVFLDVRRFGTFTWHASHEAALPVGVDPLTPGFTVRRLRELLADSRQEIKPWLLRQDRLVGLGNIYASEILHASRISPFRAAGGLDAKESRRLHGATRRILERAIEACGTTFSDFQDALGVEGSFQQFLAAYGREAEPCQRCRAPIVRRVQQQRSTYYCASCQL